jgi:tetratricopeptide (TPR) repeat protein
MTGVSMKIQTILLLTVVFLAGCAGSDASRERARIVPGFPHVPAGVDTTVSFIADTIAGHSFVSLDKEDMAETIKQSGKAYVEESDSLWKYLTMSRDTSFVVGEDDSLGAIDAFNRGAEAIIELQNLSRNATDDVVAMVRQNELLDRAQKAFEDAIGLNPFDPETKYWLAAVYQRKAVRFSQERDYDRAIEILERLVRIERGDHPIYARLAESYYGKGRWLLAAENFGNAERLLRETAFMTPGSITPGELSHADSSALFVYVYYKADSFTRLYNATDALENFNKSLALARSPQERNAAQSMINFINWDDGNIRASFERDSIIALERRGLLADSEFGYLRLFNTLRSAKARDEIDWRLAVLQFELNKHDQAADRLFRLVQRTPLDPIDGMPVDTTYLRYFEDFGIVCFNLGTRYLHQERDRHTALKYYIQATQVPWSNRARSHLEVAKLLHNNLPEAIRHAEAAVTEVHRMSHEDRKELYQLMTQLYRRSGNTDLARRYFELWRDT